MLKQAFFPIRKAGHYYVVVFSLTKTASLTILDNSDSGATYDEKYKDTVDLLVSFFTFLLYCSSYRIPWDSHRIL